MPTTCSLLLLGGVLIGGISIEDAAGIQGTLRASYPYPDGDAHGGQPSAAAAAALAAAAAYTAESAAGSPHTTFGGVTYCQFDPNIMETQQWRFEPIGEGDVVAIRLIGGSICLEANQQGGPVKLAPCDVASTQQSWHARDVNATIAQIKPASDASLCLTTKATTMTGASHTFHLETVACVAKPTNCSSLWDHHSTETGVDCTLSPRSGQLWYLNSFKQLSSAHGGWIERDKTGKVQFADFDAPLCLGTIVNPKPQPPPQPPVVNTSLPQQIWAGPLADGSIAVVLLNTGEKNASVTATWEEIGLATGVSVKVRDLWAHKTLDRAASSTVSVVVGSHDAAALLLIPNSVWHLATASGSNGRPPLEAPLAFGAP